MKKWAPMAGCIALLSCISGYLLSKPSLVGRIGIDVFYREYRFLRVWWQGALLVFIVLMLVLCWHIYISLKFRKRPAIIHYLVLLVLAVIGLYLTWQDFHQTTSHRWLRERFHIGAYLFWLTWIGITLYFIFKRTTPKTI